MNSSINNKLDNSRPRRLRNYTPPNESYYTSLVKSAPYFKSPGDFVVFMAPLLHEMKSKLTDRTRPMYEEMLTLRELIEKERPRNRVWHPPLTVRVKKSITRAATERYNAQRQRVLNLFEQFYLADLMEPLVAARESEHAPVPSQSACCCNARAITPNTFLLP